MVKKGAMIPVKKAIGSVLGIAGIGLIVMPDQTAVILCQYKAAFGVLVLAAAYFLVISGRQR